MTAGAVCPGVATKVINKKNVRRETAREQGARRVTLGRRCREAETREQELTQRCLKRMAEHEQNQKPGKTQQLYFGYTKLKGNRFFAGNQEHRPRA